MTGPYAGDLTPQEAWQRLAEDPKAQLVDVRTEAEWRFVGLPDLSQAGKRPLLVEWQRYPDGSPNPNFAEQLQAAGIGRDDTVVFLCRTGGRSAAAARLMAQAGYSQCYNILEGFEGQHDGQGHRGAVNGWKARGLPWQQS